MADRYWVGGAGTWDASSTTNWSATSGGSTGASVPTSADNVFFDSASGVGLFTVIISGTVNCLNFTSSSTTITMAGGSVNLNIYGSISLASGSPDWYYVYINFVSNSTQTINTNGVKLSNVYFGNNTSNNPNGVWNLTSNLDISSSYYTNFFMYYGTVNTNGYTVTGGWYIPNVANGGNTSTKTLNFGSSSINAQHDNQNYFFQVDNPYVVLNPGTSTVTVGYQIRPSNGGASLTFYNVVFTSLSYNAIYLGSPDGNTNYTFNNLTFTAYASGHTTCSLLINGNHTINGNLTVLNTYSINRLFIQNNISSTNNTPASQITLTVNGTLSTPNCDFQNIVIAGAAAGTLVTGGGNCGNNSGITFPASKTVYWVLSGDHYWYDTGWATSSGGSANINNFPLAQDTAVIDTFSSSGSSINLNYDGNNYYFNMASLNCSLRDGTHPFIFKYAPSNLGYFYGDMILGAGVTFTSTTSFRTFVLIFNLLKNSTLQTNGAFSTVNYDQNWPGMGVGIQLNSTTGVESLTIADSTLNIGTFQLFSGNLNINGNTLALTGGNPSFSDYSGSPQLPFTTTKTVNFGTNGKMIAYPGSYGSYISFNYYTNCNTTILGSGTIQCCSINVQRPNASTGLPADFSNIDLVIGVPVETTLSADINSSTTTIPVTSALYFPNASGITALIDGELITVGTPDTSTNQFTGSTRAQGGTLADAHSAGAKVRLWYNYTGGHITCGVTFLSDAIYSGKKLKFKSISNMDLSNNVFNFSINSNSNYPYITNNNVLQVSSFNMKGALAANITATCSGSTLTVTATDGKLVSSGMYIVYGTSSTGAQHLGYISAQLALGAGETAGGVGRYTVSSPTTISTPTSMRAVYELAVTQNYPTPLLNLPNTGNVAKGQYLYLTASGTTGPTYSTLNGSITSTSTTITLNSATGFPTSGRVWISNEQISYTGITGNQLTGCTRGITGTPTGYGSGTQVWVYYNSFYAGSYSINGSGNYGWIWSEPNNGSFLPLLINSRS
jgi:hypothetical protein